MLMGQAPNGHVAPKNYKENAPTSLQSENVDPTWTRKMAMKQSMQELRDNPVLARLVKFSSGEICSPAELQTRWDRIGPQFSTLGALGQVPAQNAQAFRTPSDPTVAQPTFVRTRNLPLQQLNSASDRVVKRRKTALGIDHRRRSNASMPRSHIDAPIPQQRYSAYSESSYIPSSTRASVCCRSSSESSTDPCHYPSPDNNPASPPHARHLEAALQSSSRLHTVFGQTSSRPDPPLWSSVQGLSRPDHVFAFDSQGSTQLDAIADQPPPCSDPLLTDLMLNLGDGGVDPYDDFSLTNLGFPDLDTMDDFELTPPRLLSPPPPPPPQPNLTPGPSTVSSSSATAGSSTRASTNPRVLPHISILPGRVVNIKKEQVSSVAPSIAVLDRPVLTGKALVKKTAILRQQNAPQQRPLVNRENATQPQFAFLNRQQQPQKQWIQQRGVTAPPLHHHQQQQRRNLSNVMRTNKNDSIALSMAKVTVWNMVTKSQQAAAEAAASAQRRSQFQQQRQYQMQQQPRRPVSVLRPMSSFLNQATSTLVRQSPPWNRLPIPVEHQPELSIRRVLQIGLNDEWRQVVCGESNINKEALAMARQFFDDSLSDLFNF